MLIDIEQLFKECEHEYCIIKMPDNFPQYHQCSDLDVLCRDKSAMAVYTVTFLNQYKNILVPCPLDFL